MCPHCRHELKPRDLVPVLSWLILGGKCRYCNKSISVQYPLVELITAGIFVASYIWWPTQFTVAQVIIFELWLVLLTGLMALLIYDLRWMLLPNRILYPLGYVAALLALVAASTGGDVPIAVLNTALGLLVGGGLFYGLFQLSQGKWIGGGDVKLGWLLGAVAGTPGRALLLIFLASILGCLVSLPLLASNRTKANSLIPFGPFLIVAAIIVQLFGADILHWYRDAFLNY
jgi:prepilin signal peptidase PulO-like enzyme (type II secretory pathway)